MRQLQNHKEVLLRAEETGSILKTRSSATTEIACNVDAGVHSLSL